MYLFMYVLHTYIPPETRLHPTYRPVYVQSSNNYALPAVSRRLQREQKTEMDGQYSVLSAASESPCPRTRTRTPRCVTA